MKSFVVITVAAVVLLATQSLAKPRAICLRGPHGFDEGEFKSDTQYTSYGPMTALKVIHQGNFLGLQAYYNNYPGFFYGQTKSSAFDQEALITLAPGEYINWIEVKWWTRRVSGVDVRQVYRLTFRSNRRNLGEYRTSDDANVPNSKKHATIVSGNSLQYLGAREVQYSTPWGRAIASMYFGFSC